MSKPQCHCMLRDRKDVVGTVIDFCPLHEAAGDLLEALKELVESAVQWTDETHRKVKKARAAIAAAEGVK